ncbi:uncharacterized protein KY384_007951 [Bacidia gigantensis]|uniref:uncharacterized protein n=1 Tax=Bacidia gigantensis TaxID=2732470 RepID=UPI001D03C865|nr:uncharacterized protein KY384_007951 [Bacidia gigantensis]KAG8527797.1 hypothetical protein KY384_007951 [Bacidia gigantensis]
MADPFSIFAGVLATAAAAIKSAKTVHEVAKGIKGASQEVQAIARDADSLHHTISLLHATLKHKEVRAKYFEDGELLEMVICLQSPLSNCEVVLQELIFRLRKQLKLFRKGTGDWSGLKSVKWALFTKNDIKELQLRLETAKATLNTALSGVSVYEPSSTFVTADTDRGKIVCDLTATLVNGTIEKPKDLFGSRPSTSVNADVEMQSSVQSIETLDLNESSHRMRLSMKTASLKEQSSLLEEDDLDIGVDSSLNRSLAQISQRLAENASELGQIREAYASMSRDAIGKTPSSETITGVDSPGDEMNSFVGGSSTVALTCYRSDSFDDCESQNSEDDFYSMIDEWSRPHTPSPTMYLEMSLSFCPELMTVEGVLEDPLFVIGSKRSSTHPSTHNYFVLYAEKREWRRVTISVRIDGLKDLATVFGLDFFYDSEQHSLALPSVVRDQVKTLCRKTDLFASVTNFSLYFRRREGSSTFGDYTRSTISEDCAEACSSAEDQILRDIQDLGCEVYRETEIETKTRKSSNCFIVRARSYLSCIERKAPFVNSGAVDGSGFQVFVNDLKFLRSLEGCSGIATFIGVVLDGMGEHLKSYLYEYPAFGSLQTMLIKADSKSEVIPWDIREAWARQIVDTVAWMHCHRAARIGSLRWMIEIGIRANGTIVFTALRTSQRHFDYKLGMMAPELRDIPRGEIYYDLMIFDGRPSKHLSQ